jgi:hypothetical protein
MLMMQSPDAAEMHVWIRSPQIADVARFQRQDTGLADAHSASERHLDAEFLATFHYRCGAVEFDGLV